VGRPSGATFAVLESAPEVLKMNFGFFFVTLQADDRYLDKSGAEVIEENRHHVEVHGT